VPIEGFSKFEFEDNGIKHLVFRKGKGPGVLLMHELPGLTPKCVELANGIVNAGFTVFVPLFFGQPNESASTANFLRLCVSREFKCFATRESGPITTWLRALSRKIYNENLSSRGVGAIGLCLTGGFVLALMVDQHLMAPVASEPALPLFPVSQDRKHALGISLPELVQAANRNIPLLGLRFSNDSKCPKERFQTLDATLGTNFRKIVIDSFPGNSYSIRNGAHSVLTNDYNDTPGHPTRQAFEEVVAFLRANL
jgi:dienelactone hydrolase